MSAMKAIQFKDLRVRFTRLRWWSLSVQFICLIMCDPCASHSSPHEDMICLRLTGFLCVSRSEIQKSNFYASSTMRREIFYQRKHSSRLTNIETSWYSQHAAAIALKIESRTLFKPFSHAEPNRTLSTGEEEVSLRFQGTLKSTSSGIVASSWFN